MTNEEHFSYLVNYSLKISETLIGMDFDWRVIQLSDVLTDMERTFNIPSLPDAHFEEKNPNVVKLYRTGLNALQRSRMLSSK